MYQAFENCDFVKVKEREKEKEKEKENKIELNNRVWAVNCLYI